jgi:acyl-CoA thioesterase-1
MTLQIAARLLASTLVGACMLIVASLTLDWRAHSQPADTSLSAGEVQRLKAARAAILTLPEIKAATAKYNEARKAFQEDRRKFPAEQSKDAALAFRQATAEFERAKQEALLASDPTIKPLLDKEAAASHSSRAAPLRPVRDIPGLPRVLIIGDSISIGYTLKVRQLLEGKANVHRIPINGGATEIGLANMAKWLGNEKWDVIHFNFGLHDAMQMSPTEFRTSRHEYAENLRLIVAQLKATGAKLIFATTTPVPDNGFISPTYIFDNITDRNEAAVNVMKENSVAIDDLYTVAERARIGQPKNIHFRPEGYDVLAEAVAASIESQLPRR